MITDKHRVVAFDFDDCLVATIKNIWAQHKHVAKEFFGVEVTDDDLRQVWGRPLPELVERVYHQPFEIVEPHLLAAKPQFPKEVFPATFQKLKQIKEAQKIIAVVTSTNTKSISIDLKQNNFPEGLIDHMFTIDDCDYHKPDKRVFSPLLALGYSPEQVVYVGDAASDFYAARDAGMDFIGVETGLLSNEDFASLEGWETSGAVAVPSVADVKFAPSVV